MTTNGAPAARELHTAVWDGSEMIVWGGTGGGIFADGGRYNPISDHWTATNTGSAPPPRFEHTAVWTGTQMIVWGGANSTTNLNDTWSYTPSQVMFLYMKP